MTLNIWLSQTDANLNEILQKSLKSAKFCAKQQSEKYEKKLKIARILEDI